MRKWICVTLETLVLIITVVLIFFFPDNAFAKAFVGFGFIWVFDSLKE